ncbi:MAG: DUF1549 domain-containing protein [Candidatus Hydrogenedentes bacterium]|nr:DUF1549 domain-containing protein [Candidatus Hydrogenedentota bacterium]
MVFSLIIGSWLCLAQAQGVASSTHWAFVPPERPPLPDVRTEAWVRNAIDRFVLARLEQEQLAPAAEADRETLVRRLCLDLTGLPPSLEEVERVLADTSEGWYGALVERLLASPHYGERWARHWMDAAQYADSDGFEKDKPRQVWAWRDWVIRAFNNDLPYDQFIIEQIAGDLLQNATQDQRVATGFLRNSMINEEGGIDPEQFRMEAQFNRMEIVGRAVLGLTVQCAQCHSHKYDPISQSEYYGMLAFLNNAHEACTSVYSASDVRQRSEILALVSGIESGIKEAHPDWHERLAAWESTACVQPEPAWEVLSLEFDDSSAGGQRCLPQSDGSYLAQGYAPTQFQPKMTAHTSLPRITALRLELIADPNLPRGGPGRSVYGACALSELELRIAPAGTPIADYDKWAPVKIASAIADVNPPLRKLGPEFPIKKEDPRVTGPIEMAIDGKSETAWSTDLDPERRNQSRCAIFKLAEPRTVDPNTVLAVRLSQQHGGWNSDDNQTNNLGRFRISVTKDDALPETALPQAVRAALAKPPAERSAADKGTIFSHWRGTVAEFAEANARIDTLLQAVPSGATQLVLQERETPRVTHRLVRGDFLRPAEEVAPGVPASLPPLESDGTPDRLDFARWLAARNAPTTARALVNRVWQQYFGTGISATTADLGTQGEAPSHPELLDWLAVEFMKSGWSLKHLHRLITGSATYRQTSNVTQDLLQRDPYSRLLARGARFRVEGETVRDIALAASGLLNPAIGGPSVYPPAPEFLFQPPASYGPKTWRVEQGAQQFRRALYTFRFRSVPYPVLQSFDAPPGDAPCTRRVRSNTPLQALTTLNEPLFFACARGLAEVTLAEGGATNESRIEYAFRRCNTRRPEAEEIATLRQFLDKQRARIAAGELNPGPLLAAVDKGAPDNNAELAAWTLVARAILNLDETISRQ